MFILYWLGIFLLMLSACCLYKYNSIDEDELPIDKDALTQILLVIAMIGGIMICVTMPFINYDKRKTDSNNSHQYYWTN